MGATMKMSFNLDPSKQAQEVIFLPPSPLSPPPPPIPIAFDF